MATIKIEFVKGERKKILAFAQLLLVKHSIALVFYLTKLNSNILNKVALLSMYLTRVT